ncbi:phosphatase PAP2 family protein [Bryobacter aggregatus]|uniref:phosphatase PAP2 family protein n=1 Tax=Bryobacter aggregatus TaxID=360054 RepID=UPI0004E139A6|nr:phosphatase PAP2 family protein [Bryobacter aggregatus]
MPVYRAVETASTESENWRSRCRGGERVAASFFFYLAVLGWIQGIGFPRILAAAFVPVLIVAVANGETLNSRRWTSYCRDWLASALILVAYWEIDWFATGRYLTQTQSNWVNWDRMILDGYGLRAGIEAAGPIGPFLLEFCYLLLYGVPTFCLFLIYWHNRRSEVDRFYRVFFLGAFAAYGLLPLIAIQSPRLFLPGEDLPAYMNVFRRVNVYLLDHFDIATSVFPSGHVAVAFSCFWGLYSVLPEKKILWGGLLAFACIVFLATIYGRYHYAADGMASFVIATLAWRACAKWSRND